MPGPDVCTDLATAAGAALAGHFPGVLSETDGPDIQSTASKVSHKNIRPSAMPALSESAFVFTVQTYYEENQRW